MDKSVIKIAINNNINIVDLTGDLIINNIESSKTLLDSKLDLNLDLKIQIADVSNIDITFIQLIVSLKKSWMNKGLNIDIQADLNDEIRNLIQNSGFEEIFKN